MLEQLPLESSHPEPGGHSGDFGAVSELQQLGGREGWASGLQEVFIGLLESFVQELSSLLKRGLSLHKAGNLLHSTGRVRVDNVSYDNKDLGAGGEIKNDNNHWNIFKILVSNRYKSLQTYTFPQEW